MAEKLEFDLSVKGGAENNQLNQSLKTAEKSAISLEGALETAVGVFGGNLLTRGLEALKNQLGKAVDESISFKRAQLEIETILPKNEKLTANLVAQLENLSKQYGTTATSQAKAYYEIISAGVSDAADGAKLLARANELATGGVTDTANTIDLLTTVYNVYGKELATTEEASDSLFKTVQLGKTTIAELSSDLGQALPIAKSFGVGLDEVGAILAQLTNSGISTSESVTLLNAVLAAIARNGEQLGEGFNSTAVQTEGLGVVLDRLRERTNGSNDALFKLLGRQEAVRAVQSLTAKGLDNYNAVLVEYANKAGVASEASKKILSEDTGKQFEILSSRILQASKDIVGPFVGALGIATKAINDLFSGNEEQEAESLRQIIKKVNDNFKDGTISLEQYNLQIDSLNNKLSTVTSSLSTANRPLVTLVVGLEEDAKKISLQIASIKNGFDELNLGPVQRDLRLADLNAQLDTTNAKIKELKSVSSGVSNIAVEAPTVRGEAVIEAEKKLQAELAGLRLKFATEEQTFNDQLALAQQEQSIIRGEEITTQIYDQKLREADAAFQAKLIENELIKDADNQRLANQQAALVKEQALIAAGNAKRLTDEKNAKAAQVALEASFQNSKNTLIGQGFGLAAALAKDGSKTQFLIQKAAALAEIAIGDGKARALIPAQTALIPFPANIAAAASLNAYVTAQTALGAAIVGASAIKGFADGGIVGATSGADNRLATVRDGEMILNASQQGKLFDAINNGNLGGGDIVIKIDEREIFRAVRNQLNSGARLAI